MHMTTVSYKLVGTPNDFNAFGMYLQAYGNNAQLNSPDFINYTVDVFYPEPPTDTDVQYMVDVLDAYQDPPYFITYSETQIGSCLSEWSTSTQR